MKHYLPLLLCLLLFVAGFARAAQAEEPAGEAKSYRAHGGKPDCDASPAWCKNDDGACNSEMRGRCGKRRGDWYGARQPVAGAAEAHALLRNYFAGREYSVSEITEKKWGFRADILDRDGKVIDRVMIDKRTGRIRSLD